MSDDRVLSNIISEALLDTGFVRLSQRYSIADSVLARLSSAGYQVIKAAEAKIDYGVKMDRPDGHPDGVWCMTSLTSKDEAGSASYDYERDGYGVVDMQRTVSFGPWLPVEQEGPR